MRRVLKYLGIIAFSTVLFIAFLPTIISSNLIGRPLITNILIKTLELEECSYDKLTLGWLTDFSLSNFSARPALAPSAQFCLKELKTNQSLFSLLVHPFDLGEIEINDPYFSCKVPKTFTNIQPLINKQANISSSLENENDPFALEMPTITSFGACKGRIRIKDCLIEVIDAKAQQLFIVQIPKSIFQGDLSLQGAFRYALDAHMADAVEKSYGTAHALLSYKHDSGIKGTASCSLPALSVSTVEAVIDSLAKINEKIPPLRTLLGDKISYSLSFDGDTKEQAHIACNVQTKSVHVKTNATVQKNTITIAPGLLFDVNLAQDSFSRLLAFYKTQLPCLPVESIKAAVSLSEPCLFNMETKRCFKPCSISIRAPDTLWKSNGSTFYSNVSCDVEFDDKASIFQMTTAVKKDKIGTEQTTATVDVHVSNLDQTQMPFTLVAALEGGFVASLAPQPYARFLQACMQPHFSYKASINGNIYSENKYQVDGEFFLKCPLGKKHAKFSVDKNALRINHAHADMSFYPQIFSHELSGSLCSVKGTVEQLLIPFTKDISRLTQEMTLDASFSCNFPSVEYKGRPVIENFSLHSLLFKKINEETISFQGEQLAQYSEDSLAPHLIACIPYQGSFNSTYHLNSGEFACKWDTESSAITTKADVKGVCLFNKERIVVQQPWIVDIHINKPQIVQKILPLTFHDAQITVKPFIVEKTNSGWNIDKDMNASFDIHQLSYESLECNWISSLSYANSTKQWNFISKIVDLSNRDLLAVQGSCTKNFEAKLDIECFPQTLECIKHPEFLAYKNFIDGFTTAKIHVENKNLLAYMNDMSATLLCKMNRAEVGLAFSCHDGLININALEKKKPCARALIDQEVINLLKKHDLISSSFQLQSPCVVEVSSCELQTNFDQKLRTPTALAGDVVLTSDPLKTSIHGQSINLLGTKIALHIEDAKKAELTFCSIPSDTVSKTSLRGACTISYTDQINTLSLEKISVQGNVSIQAIPATLISAFVPKAEEFILLLEPDLSCDIHFTSNQLKTGDVRFSIKSKNVTCNLDNGHIQNGVLSLTTPLTARILVEKKRGEAILKKFLPFISSLERPQEISLAIGAKNTSIPLKNFRLANIRLPSIELNVGKVEIKTEGIVKSLLKTLHAKSGKTTTVWFTPMYASLSNGIFTLSRIDILAANQVHMFTWGSANIANNTLSMYVAIPNETLQVLGFSIATPRPLLIPIQGPLDAPSVDCSFLSARLAGAGAAKYAKKDSPFQILGSALEVVSTIGENNVAIPAPMTTPFPWEN